MMPTPLDAGYLERLFEGAALAVFACLTDGRIVRANRLGRALCAARSVSGSDPTVRELLPLQQRAEWDEHSRQVVTSLQPSEFRASLETPDGRTDYAVWLAPLLDDGQLQGLSVWFHDITARMQMRRTTRKLERLTTLGTMSGAVAHHYNNLLCSIGTSLEYARNLNTLTAVRKAMQRTSDAVSRAADLTHQLLAFAQADYRLNDLSDLTEMVLHYVDDHEVALQNRGVLVRLDWQPIPMIALPRQHFNIVLQNLVSNAAEAMSGGGTVSIELGPHGPNQAYVRVRDNGSGIHPQHMERLFEPFFTTKGELGAGISRQAGMGLAVVHGLVHEMGGTISASNNPEGGACFEVLLPTSDRNGVRV